MLRSTRPIKVAETPPADGKCPVQLNLLKADLVTRSAHTFRVSPTPDESSAPRRRVDLPQRRIDLAHQVAADTALELSDAPPVSSGATRPTAGLGSVRDFSYAKLAADTHPKSAVPVESKTAPTACDPEIPRAVESPALARVIESWPSLSPSIRAAILAMVEAVAAGLDAT